MSLPHVANDTRPVRSLSRVNFNSVGAESGNTGAGQVFAFYLDDSVGLESGHVMPENICAPAPSSASHCGTLLLGTSTDSAVCLSPALRCPLPGFVYSEALCKPPWFLSLLLYLSFPPFILVLFYYFPYFLFTSSYSWAPLSRESYILLAGGICKRDPGRGPSPWTFLLLQYTGSSAGPRKKGLAGYPFNTTFLLPWILAVTLEFLLPLFYSSLSFFLLLLFMFFHSCPHGSQQKWEPLERQ